MKTGFMVMVLVVSQWVLADALPDKPHIVVTGNAERQAVPDQLALTVGIGGPYKAMAEGVDDVDARTAELVRRLKAVGLAREQINSAQLRVQPRSHWEKDRGQVFDGVEVWRTVRLLLTDLERYGEVMAAITESGAGRIQQTRMLFSDAESVQGEVLEEAVSNAREKAERIARASGARLGPVWSVTNHGGMPARPMPMLAEARLKDAAFEPGTVSISDSVEVVFLLD